MLSSSANVVTVSGFRVNMAVNFLVSGGFPMTSSWLLSTSTQQPRSPEMAARYSSRIEVVDFSEKSNHRLILQRGFSRVQEHSSRGFDVHIALLNIASY